MNFSSLFGVLFGIGVMYAALRHTTDNLAFFMDLHGMLIVMGEHWLPRALVSQ